MLHSERVWPVIVTDWLYPPIMLERVRFDTVPRALELDVKLSFTEFATSFEVAESYATAL